MDDKKLEELKDEAVEEVSGGLFHGRQPNEPAIGDRPKDMQPRAISGEIMDAASPDSADSVEKKIFPVKDYLI